jgi:predicted nucleotidyltransferase
VNFGLSEKAIAMIVSFFRGFPEVREVRMFGSRAMGNEQENSDIDLALWGNIDRDMLGRISLGLDELSLPYLFDVKVYDRIDHEALKRHIDEHGKTLYEKDR